ncbi:hypothetical protein ANANG_G00163150 [Anguilla anguilla]|uniref:IF rod domain-containing protein n=1 Tax=Anguilla anguilla TaxID=7936 RepID=A0A9D3RUY5_ANGAN|nr:hypothetical protein ANANG_G00163150 [Anguilla anguilla]
MTSESKSLSTGKSTRKLLASKMSLDVEITAYKKLLDSEETRLKSGGGVTVHMSKTAVMGGAGRGGGGGGAGRSWPCPCRRSSYLSSSTMSTSY